MSPASADPGKARAPRAPAPSDTGKPRKLSFKERQVWTELPGRIEALEHERLGIQARMSDPSFFQGPVGEIRTASQRLKEIPDEIERAFQLWGELDERA